MTRTIPALAAALLMTAVATPVFAQAAISEPGYYSFYYPNGDVLHANTPTVRHSDANAYYGDGAMRETRPFTGAPVGRHHRRR